VRIVLRQKSNSRIWASQIKGKPGVLKADFVKSGIPESDLEELELNETGYQTLLNLDPALSLSKKIEEENVLISQRTLEIQNARDRKLAVTQLKAEGKIFKHHDNNGKKI